MSIYFFWLIFKISLNLLVQAKLLVISSATHVLTRHTFIAPPHAVSLRDRKRTRQLTTVVRYIPHQTAHSLYMHLPTYVSPFLSFPKRIPSYASAVPSRFFFSVSPDLPRQSLNCVGSKEMSVSSAFDSSLLIDLITCIRNEANIPLPLFDFM